MHYIKIKNLLLLSGLLIIIGGFVWFSYSDVEVNKEDNNLDKQYNIIHKGYYGDVGIFDRAYDNNNIITPISSVVAGIIPHHLLASHMIASFFQGLEGDYEPEVVVLIGPDHMDRSYYNITTSLGVWDTPYGFLEPDIETAQVLVDAGVVGIDEKVFSVEHSIIGEVAFIKKSFPDTKIIPITIKSLTTTESIENLVNLLHEILPKNSLVIGSVDFAHYVTHEEALRQNEINIDILKGRDTSKIENMFVDSPQTVRAVLNFANLRRVTQTQILDSADTVDVVADYSEEEVTSYITIYFSK